MADLLAAMAAADGALAEAEAEAEAERAAIKLLADRSLVSVSISEY